MSKDIKSFENPVTDEILKQAEVVLQLGLVQVKNIESSFFLANHSRWVVFP